MALQKNNDNNVNNKSRCIYTLFTLDNKIRRMLIINSLFLK